MTLITSCVLLLAQPLYSLNISLPDFEYPQMVESDVVKPCLGETRTWTSWRARLKVLLCICTSTKVLLHTYLSIPSTPFEIPFQSVLNTPPRRITVCVLYMIESGPETMQ